MREYAKINKFTQDAKNVIMMLEKSLFYLKNET